MQTSGSDAITAVRPERPNLRALALAHDRPASYALAMRRSLAPIALALFFLATASACSKAKDGGGSGDATSPLAAVADFPKKEPSSWINGAPVPLEQARGAAVLIEAWAPA